MGQSISAMSARAKKGPTLDVLPPKTSQQTRTFLGTSPHQLKRPDRACVPLWWIVDREQADDSPFCWGPTLPFEGSNSTKGPYGAPPAG